MTAVIPVAGWTLIHFLWQGAAIALVMAIALRAVRYRSANLRYLVACAGLGAMLAAPIATAALLRAGDDGGPARLKARATYLASMAIPSRARLQPNVERRPRFQPSGSTSVESERATTPALTAIAAFVLPRLDSDRIVRSVVFVWVLGVATLLGRMAAGWWYVRRLHRIALDTEASRWQAAADLLSQRLGLRRVAHVAESVLVEVPTVVGWLRPAIILPVAAIAHLTPSQVEAILAHELAHIRRCDYAVNLAQTLAETLLFYHPAVWWLSRRIRTEREHCCDDIAVATCGDAVGYAEALTELETWRTASSVLALAATGGSLLDRVRRILRVPIADEPRSPSWALTLALTVLFTAGAGGVQGVPGAVTHAGARVAEAIHARVVLAPAAAPAAPRGGIADGISSGVAGGIRGGVAGGISGGIAGGITGGIAGEIAGGISKRTVGDVTVRVADGVEPQAIRDVVEAQVVAPPPPPPPPPPPVPAPPAFQGAAPPAPATPPAPPAPPAPAAAPRSDHMSMSRHDSDWTITWSNNGQRVDVKAHGEMTVADDLKDIETLSDGGYVTIRDWTGLLPRTVELKSTGGKITRTYFIGGVERPWNDEARAFLATEVAQLVHRTGFGAEGRVKSILQKKGVSGVLDEVDRAEGDYVRRLYLQLLLENAPFDHTTILPVLQRIKDKMASDYDRRVLLTQIATKTPLDDKMAAAYLPVVASMRSDYDRREVLNAVLARRPLSPGVAHAALEAAGSMHSAYDKREVLARMLTGAPPLTADEKSMLLGSVTSIHSDYDCREVLVKFVQTYGVDDTTRQPFLAAVDSIGGAYDRRMVLTELAKRRDLPHGVLQGAFDAVSRMRSDYDRAEVLMAFLRSQQIDASLRQAFMSAADSIHSSSDQDRVLAALARSERR
jgi:beta-lactamase regulating signal transducer with metallopeptidase domain